MQPLANLFPNILPTALIGVGALVTLASEPFLSRDRKHIILPWIAALFLVLSALSLFWVVPGVAYGILAMDSTRKILLLTLSICGLLGVSGMSTQLARQRFAGGEAYALMLLSLAGSMLMVQSNDLLALFVGMELSAIPVYALVGMQRRSLEASEGLFKYFVHGALFGAVFLYGAALWYGSTGSTNMGASLIAGREILSLVGFLLLALALFFKTGAAPLHFWVADTYTGASISVTGFMSTTVKIGALTGLSTLWLQASASNPLIAERGLYAILIIGMASIIIGAFSALGQTRARRMMAFSAVTNAGYLVLALLVPGSAIWYFLVAYALASGLILAALASLTGSAEEDDNFAVLKGLARRQPILGVIISFGLISLAGLPPVAGFLAKFGVLAGLFGSGHMIIATFALIAAVVSFVYYFRLLTLLWQSGEDNGQRLSSPALLRFALLLGSVALLAISILPGIVQ